MNQTEALTYQDPVTYFMHKDGLGVASRFGGAKSCAEFVIVRKTATAPDAPGINEGIVMKNFVPPDGALLGRILAIFKRTYAEHGSEMFLHLGWNKKKKRYYVASPRCQAVSSGYLKYNARPGRYVGSIHSHGGMSAFFSSDDDRNEMGGESTAPGIYAVAGGVAGSATVLLTIAGMGCRKDLTNVMPQPVEYNLTDREYKWWTKSLQPLSYITAQKSGFILLSPQGDALRWASTGDDLLPFADKADRIIEATAPKTQHKALVSHVCALNDDYGYDECWWGSGRKAPTSKRIRRKDGAVRLDLFNKNPRISCAARLDAIVQHAEKDLDKALELMNAETYAALCAAVDRTRSHATCEPSLLDVEESDFTWLTQ